jgi:predicted unusual protein kinase regulating ubiquinone biosynthesis (AarF/ABC1/UbiB family)
MKRKLAEVKSSSWSRGLALAKMSVSAGTQVASHAIGNLFANEAEKTERFKELLKSQAALLANELGQLKGSLMKAGQMLSVVGEHLLPPEVNQLLKTLQSQSPPVDWPAIERTLKRNLGEKLSMLEVETEALASASLGQVHRAKVVSGPHLGANLALKIQYPGVDQAIEGDLKALRSMLSLAKIIPKGPRYDEMFREVKQMLHQEVDYSRELEFVETYRKLVGNDPRFIIPQSFPDFCTHRILALSYEEGIGIDSPEVAALSQERRNRIAEAFFDLYLREIFHFGMVQTDAHLGNFRVRLAEREGEPDRIVLLDFGAVRKVSQSFLKPYHRMLRGVFHRDGELALSGAEGVGFIQADDSPEMRASFESLLMMVGEPIAPETSAGGGYEWVGSDLPKRLAKAGAEVAVLFRLRPPPREVIFLDRKLPGLFTFMTVLRARFDARRLLEGYVQA